MEKRIAELRVKIVILVILPWGAWCDNSIFTSTQLSQSLTAGAVNSLPLFERI